MTYCTPVDSQTLFCQPYRSTIYVLFIFENRSTIYRCTVCHVQILFLKSWKTSEKQHAAVGGGMIARRESDSSSSQAQALRSFASYIERVLKAIKEEVTFFLW